jgi:hypothetical protein
MVKTKNIIKPSARTKTGTQGLPLHTTRCLWCDYTDKVERDLEWHFLEEHRDRLYKMKADDEERRLDPVWTKDSFSWMYSNLDYRLYKAVKLAKRKMWNGEQMDDAASTG